MPLDDDIVLKNCYYWASRMVCREVEFNELVSIGYLVGKQLSDARKLKDWIRFTMLHFIVDTVKQTNLHIEFKEELGAKFSDQKTHDYSNLYEHIEKAGLTSKQKEIINLVFFQSMTQREVAKIMNVTPATINDHVKKSLEKIYVTYKFKELK